MTKKEIEDHTRFLQDFALCVARAATVPRDERPVAISGLVKFAYKSGFEHCTKHDTCDNVAQCDTEKRQDIDRVRVEWKEEVP